MDNKKTLFFLLLFTFFWQNLFAEDVLLNNSIKNPCYSNISPREVDDLVIDNFSIEFSKNKKWIKNLFNVHKDLEKKRNENEMVLKEISLVEDEDIIYKLVGPILVKTETDEAKMNLEKRVGFIKDEM